MKRTLSAIAVGILLLTRAAGQAIPASGNAVQSNCTSSCQGTLGQNIYPNGDFGSGVPNILPVDPHLAPGYIYQFNPPPDDGYYCITNSTAPWGSFGDLYWIDIEDNGPEPNGYMMVVNASYAPGLFFENTVPVCENTLYEFSVDVINLFQSQFNATILPNLTFLIDNVPYCSTGDIPLDETWHTERFSFTTIPGQTSVHLAMRNNAPGGFGNDIALDNISFRACGPELLAPDTVRYCQGAAAQLEVHWLNTPFNPPHFQWQVFMNGDWQNIPGADSIALTVISPQNGDRYRLLAASAQANLGEESCRVVTQEIRLLESPAVRLQTSGTDVACFGESNGSAQVQAIAGAAPFQFHWSNGGASSMVSGLTTGNYQVTVTDAFGCMATDSIMLHQPAALSSAATSFPVSCFGATNGEAIATASGGTSPYAFAWTGGFSGDSIQGLPAGPYQLTVTDAHGCTFTTTTTISSPPALSLTTSVQEVNCFNGNDGSAMASVEGGTMPYSFAWNNGNNTAQISGLHTGQFTVTVTDAQGCTATENLDINSPEILTANVSNSNVSCNGGLDGMASVTTQGGAGPYTYLWNTGQTSPQLSNIPAAAYVITITDSHGCTIEANSSVTEPPLLSSSIATTEIPCFGGSNVVATCSASGGTAPYQYHWNQGQTSAQINGLAAGTFTVTVSDANGCSAVSSVNILQPSLLQINVSNSDASCFGGNNGSAAIQVAGGSGPYQFSWNQGQTSAQINGLSAGTYTVTVTDAHGCAASQEMVIQEPPALSLNSIAVDNHCFGDHQGEASVQANGGQAPYQFNWNNGQNSSQLTGLSGGNYSVTVTDAHACTVSASMTVLEPPLLDVTLSVTDVDCAGNSSGGISAQPVGGTAPYFLVWSNAQNGLTINNLSAGNYSLILRDSQGCTTTANVIVTEPALLTGNIHAQEVSCFGFSDGEASIQVNGGTTPYTYHWQNGQASSGLVQLPAGNYAVTATDAHGCSVSGSTIITQPPALTSQMQSQAVDCYGAASGSAVATASGGTPPYDYLWQNGAKTSQILQLLSGAYQIQITDAHHCLATNEVVVDQPPPLQMHTQGSPVSCPEVADGRATAFVSGGTSPYGFLWNNQQISSGISQLSPGAYSVTVTDMHGCTIAGQQEVGVAIAPSIDLGLDQTVALGEAINLTAHVNLPSSQIKEISWMGDGGEQTCANCFELQFIPLKNGCEQVTLHTIQGCQAGDEVCFEVRPDRHIYAPNVFLPNDNGKDDYFTIFSDASVKEIRYLRIYDRWGNHLFQAEHIPTNQETSGWDGTFRGRLMEPGVFAWVASVEFIDGQVILLKGDVTLLR